MNTLNTPNSSFRQRVAPHGYVLLLAALVAFVLLQPLFRGPIVAAIFTTAVALGAVAAVAMERRDVIIAAVIGIPFVTTVWLNSQMPDSSAMIVASRAFGLAFFVHATLVVLVHVVRTGEVTPNTIFGAAAVYLMIAHTWCYAYLLTNLLHHGSFSFTHPQHIPGAQPTVSEMYYFSVITLTTLGFGDITPITGQARALVALEAVAGPFYLAVLVARLVGMYRPSREKL